MTREVTVKGSSALGCETKMVREWLRVSCRPKNGSRPEEVKTLTHDGQQAYVFSDPGRVASLVVQIVKGKGFMARYAWTTSGMFWRRTLYIQWQGGRPRIFFDPAVAGPDGAAGAVQRLPGDPCRNGETPMSCRCPNGTRGTSVCLPRSLTWAGCSCR